MGFCQMNIRVVLIVDAMRSMALLDAYHCSGNPYYLINTKCYARLLLTVFNRVSGVLMRRYRLLTVLALATWLIAVSAAEAIEFEFTRVDVPDASRIDAYGINNRGEIVGTFTNAQMNLRSGFLLDNRGVLTVIDYPDPGTVETNLYGINDRGQITGYFLALNLGGNEEGLHSFLFAKGVFTGIEVPSAIHL